MKYYQEYRIQLEEKIDIDKAKLHQLQLQLDDLSEKREKALNRKVNAEKNELLCSVEEITKSLKSSISEIQKEVEKYKKDLYDKLRIKSDSARVMTPKNVENYRYEKENSVRILENEQRKYWRIIGQSDEKYGVGFIAFFREQYRDIEGLVKSDEFSVD